MALYLASQSPRRRALLRQIGVAFSVVDVSVPEVPAADEAAAAYVERVARAKAAAGLRTVAERDVAAVVLGADTEVVLDGRVFGKPRDADAAAAMLRALAGRTHRVVSVVCCMRATASEVAVVESAVTFAALDASVIARYVATGEPFGKAGGYAIQGRAAVFVTHLDGSYSGVVGLPLHATARLLARAGMGV
ncbi:MAG TPA: Maf family protein [Rhodanobacteraceae bacterium]